MMPSFTKIFGTEDVLLKHGSAGYEKVSTATALDGLDCVGFYFSAHWCPPCKQFTPVLAEKYKTLKAAGERLEIVYVSGDKDTHEFDEYFGTMPWLALPQGHPLIAQLNEMYSISGIPALLLLDKEGVVYNSNGRGFVAKGAKFPWIPPPPQALNNFTETKDGVNDFPSAMLLLDGGVDEAKSKALLDEFKPVAEEFFAGKKVKFFYVPTKDAYSDQIRGLTKTSDAKHALLLLDIPDDGGYYIHDPSKLSMRDFVARYLDGNASADRQQME